ncbi:MAG: diacylglycerol kinase family protein [Calditrichia bacterium]
MNTAVLLNMQAGKSTPDVDYISDLFKRAGIQFEIFPTDPSGISETVKKIINKRPQAVVVGGGDGTLNSVAGQLLGRDIPLGVLPLGTLNHFAGDAGIPAEPDHAESIIAESVPRRIDVGEVNGHIFLNNSSMGLYPRAVRMRNKYLRRLGGRKWLAMLIATISVFRKFPLFHIHLRTESENIHLTTPFVFVGNNRYQLNLFKMGTRTTFTGGELSLYTANCSGRSGILRLITKTIFNRLRQDQDFNLDYVKRVEIETAKSFVRVALDGELIKLKPPLLYKIRPAELPVFLPEKD